MYSFVILGNETLSDTFMWEEACKCFADKVRYRVVNITQSNWLEEIFSEKFDMLLAKPGGVSSQFKILYDERLNILVNDLNCKVYPTYREILIYENKKYFSYWLKAMNIPHAETWVFYSEPEAKVFLKRASYPLVAKINIGASGNGVQIIKNYQEGLIYIKNIFTKGKTSKVGPKLEKGKILRRIWRKITHLEELKERLHTYKAISNDLQKGFCLFQEYIKHKYEWRVVCIGDSYFAHKKVVVGDKASGSLIKKYDKPSQALLDFSYDIMHKTEFLSQAIDIFEPEEGLFLVNEMQCIFGQSDPYQMKIDGETGRYKKIQGMWTFENGDFNINQSYNLRVEHIISILDDKKCG